MKIGKFIKRFLLIIGIFLALLIGAMVAIPYFFKDELLAALQEQINENVNAEVHFDDASLSLFRHFPKLSLRLEGLDITGKAPFEQVHLVQAETIDFAVDLLSVTKSDRPLEINSIYLKGPSLHISVLKDGTANYDIALDTEAETPETPAAESAMDLQVKLDRIRIENGKLLYEDRAGDMLVAANSIQFEGKGDFTLDLYHFLTQTLIEDLTVEMGGISYLKKATVSLEAGLEANLPENKYTLKENSLKVNALELLADGYVALPENGIEMDLSFEAPANDFRQLLSLVPNAYIQGYEDVRIDGSFALNGQVKGLYADDNYPGFSIQASIDQGSFKYPDLPLGVDRIRSQIGVQKPQGDLDLLEVNIPVFSFALGGSPFEGHFRLKTPMSDPDVDTRMKGQLDLAAFSKAFPMEGIEQLAGLIKADVQVQTRLSTIEREDYENVSMNGNVEISQLVYHSADMPPVEVRSLTADFSPQAVNIPAYDLKLGKSDLSGSGRVENLLAWFSPEKTMYGTLTARSDYFDAGEWAGEESSDQASPSTADTPAAATEKPFDRFDFAFDAQFKDMVYDTYSMKNMVAKGRVTPNLLTVDQFSMLLDQSDLQVKGAITNVWDYLYEDGVLGGDLAIDSRFLDLNPFMEEAPAGETPPAESETNYEPIQIPENIAMTMRAKVQKLRYTDIELRDLDSKLVIEDQQVILENCRAKGFNGDLNISGSYDTQDPEEPAFSFKYDLRKLDFQETFQAFNTFQMLAPIGRYMDGAFTSTLVMDGTLGKDMMPKYNTLSAEGFLETIDAVVASYPPLEEVGNKLNLSVLDKLSLENTRNWFEVRDGRVELKEFDQKAGDIDMRIGGSHGFDQEMDYRIVAKIPRKMLDSSPVGAAADKGMGLLREQAGKLGVDIQQAAFVNVQINLQGNIKDPKVGIKLLGGDGESTVQDAAEETVKEAITKEKEKLQGQAEERLAAEKQKAQEKLQQVTDSLERVAAEKAKELGKEAAGKAGEEAAKKAEEVLGKEAKKGVEDIKKEIEDFNPFKKKKKKDGG